MKVYFTASMHQRTRFGDAYKRIYAYLEKSGFQIFHHGIVWKKDERKDETDDERAEVYKRSLKWISQSDIFVAEASYPSSLNIGHEITIALEKGKPVIILYKKGFDSMFLSSLEVEKLILIEYADDNLEQSLKEAIEFARDQADVRFNFFISPTHVSYLDKIAKDRRIPRSVYLRELIERDMKKNKDSFESAV